MQNKHNNETNFPVNATKGAQVLALVFVIGAAVFTNGDQTAIAANAPVQPHSGILISTPPPPSNLKARKGAYYAFKGHSRANSFADFYKQTQTELFSALDNALSQKAEDTLTEFAAVKKADVQLQTQLGNRKGQIAANVIGAFVESQSSAFGWQVRAFGAEDGGKGANVGVFYRNIADYTKIGMNSFVDYEDGDYGEFYRASIGGEISTSEYSFAANYYLPITDDKRGGGNVAFSQKGYDANLRIAIPRLDFLKVAADYYHYDGEYGVEDDKGLRYGLEVQPISDLRIGVFYDDGGEKFGGDIAYTYNFGIPQKRESKVAFSPDLFSPVLREYSQRIISTTTLQIEVLRTPTLTSFITTTIPVMTITNIIGDFVSLTTFMTAAGLTLTTAMTTMMTVASRMASVLLTVNLDGINVITTFGRSRILATLPTIGTPRPHGITITTQPNVPNTNDSRAIPTTPQQIPVGQLVIFPPSNPGMFTATVVEGSEQFISITTLVSTTTEMQTSPPITTETRMTNAATPSTMEVITPERMITTAMTAFLIRTITLGLPTTNIGAAIDNSHLPPSFPLSFPQVPKLALAAIPRSQLSFPRRRESNRAFGAVIIA